MKNERETQEYLPPQEQLIIAAKIRGLCEATVETFDPEIHVADAQHIVKALDPRIKPAGKYTLRYYSNSSSTSQVRSGATNAGNVNARFNQERTKKVEFGVHEYRIGNYVATKSVQKRFNYIRLEEFWDRGSVNEAFDKYPEATIIRYDAKSFDILRISKTVSTIKKQYGFNLWNRNRTLTIISERENPLWRRKK